MLLSYFYVTKCQHGDSNLIQLHKHFEIQRGVFNPLQHDLIEDGKTGSPRVQILPHYNGRVEGAICHFMTLYWKVLSPLNSLQQLLLKARLFVLSRQLPLPPPREQFCFHRIGQGDEK